MDIKNPDPGELKLLVKRISEAFKYDDGESIDRDFPQLYNPSNSKNLWIAMENGKIMAHAGYFPSYIKIEGNLLPVAGIGGVYTEPEFQGKGLASTLVDHCCAMAQKDGAALAFLWSDRHDFYSKLGFRLLGRQWTIHFIPEDSKIFLERAKALTNIEKYRVENNPQSENFFAQSLSMISNYPLGIVRSLTEQKQYLGSNSCKVTALWEGDALKAYFVFEKGKDLKNYIHEWAGEEAGLFFLASYCLERAGVPIHLISPQFMPEEVPWIYSLDKLKIPMQAEQMALVRLLNFDELKKVIITYLTKMGLDPAFISFERDNDKFRAEFSKGLVYNFTEDQFLGFIFGPDLPANQKLRAFFPVRLWYWGMDSV